MREILIAVTFRDFIDDYNSNVQTKFLESIKKQTYQNYKLVVTNFKEKKVEAYLKQSGINFVLHQSKYENSRISLHGQPISFTEIISNTFQHLEKGKHIILFTNVDNCFDENFFEEMIHHFVPDSGGTSYPPFHYYNIDEFEKNTPNSFYDYKNMEAMPPYSERKRVKSFVQYEPNIFVPECAFIDGDLMLNHENASVFLEHEMLGAATGITLSLMFSFYAKRLINLIFVTRVHSIESSRIKGVTKKDLSNENLEIEERKKNANNYMANEQEANYDILRSFCQKRLIENKYLDDSFFLTQKLRINARYHPVGNVLKKLYYYTYLLYYIFRVHGKWRWTLSGVLRYPVKLYSKLAENLKPQKKMENH